MRNGMSCGLECGLNAPGLGTSADIYAQISNMAANGSSNLGDISTFLLNLGLGVEAARGALNTVAANVGQDPNQLAAINAELQYLNSGAYASAQNKNNTWLFVGAGVLLLIFALKRR